MYFINKSCNFVNFFLIYFSLAHLKNPDSTLGVDNWEVGSEEGDREEREERWWVLKVRVLKGSGRGEVREAILSKNGYDSRKWLKS